jgi:diaminohydroxyphosphoribosylaminopyrimidine deaminase / 5-amino-6-(5-phosphoribosylamino)uracil reductase
MRGRGSVEPNPMVGCVIVRDDQIVGEGYHQKFGGPHAEPNALAAAADKTEGATVYVSLEPCCHRHKKTPPCTEVLIPAKVARVVAACHDPNPAVSGRGIQRLREAGIKAEDHMLELEAKQLNAAFFQQTERRRPYVTLKWAQTADNKVAGPGGKKLAISNARSLKVMHELRGRSDAILVGLSTVLSDDPVLSPHGEKAPRAQLRVVLDFNLAIPLTSQLVRTATKSPVLICCGEGASRQKKDQIALLQKGGVEVMTLQEDGNRLSLEHLLKDLGRRGMTHLLVEPGPKLAQSFLHQNLADRVWVFHSPRKAGAPDAPDAVGIDYPMTGSVPLDGDELREHLNPASSAFHCLAKSADFFLAEHRQ